MRLTHLQVSDYRNFHRLDLPLSPGVSVFVGDNAHGKSNLLECVYLLATMRGMRAETDGQLVRREVLGEPIAAARVVASVETAAGPLKVEVAVLARPGSVEPVGKKTVRINGVPKRLSDAVGHLTAVLFTADDMQMISGSPSLRRRFMDLALGQVDPQYASARGRFERVLTQRNHLLKRVREGEAQPDQLEFWDSELARDGGLLFERRAAFVDDTAALAAAFHESLAPGERLDLRYLARVEGDRPLPGEAEPAYADALRRGLHRDVAAGMTLQGPHRDDLQISLDGLAASGYASRAQQRTISLSLRLAESRFLMNRRGEAPVLLLDDVLSEMDSWRRASVLRALQDVEQMLVTGTDWDRFPEGFLSRATLFEVEAGSVRPLVRGLAVPRTGEM